MVVGDGSMSYEENQVHFGSWCIVSSPLILAYNLSDTARHELVWDIITNKEAIQINQMWAGAPGHQVLHSLGASIIHH
jgi:alpha-galactosidase